MSNFEIPNEMRDFAEKSVVQARKAFEGLIGAAHKTVDAVDGSTKSVQANTQDLTRRAISYAEQNVSAAFDLAHKIARATDVQEVLRLQSEYVKAQAAAMQTQMKELGETVQKVAAQSFKRDA